MFFALFGERIAVCYCFVDAAVAPSIEFSSSFFILSE